MFGTKILEETRSKYNGNIRVVKSLGLGTYIQANGLTQSGGIVETFWKQTLRKVKTITLRDKKLEVKNVLILGLGGGTLVNLIHKSWPTVIITGVDIDPLIVDLGIKYLKLDTDKVKIVIGDVSNLPNLPNFPNRKFDLIIVDLYNGDQFPKQFETDKFIQLVRCHLASNGIIIFNRLYYKDKIELAEKFGIELKKNFKSVESYHPITNIMFICQD